MSEQLQVFAVLVVVTAMLIVDVHPLIAVRFRGLKQADKLPESPCGCVASILGLSIERVYGLTTNRGIKPRVNHFNPGRTSNSRDAASKRTLIGHCRTHVPPAYDLCDHAFGFSLCLKFRPIRIARKTSRHLEL
jgi:hypothetical protein